MIRSQKVYKWLRDNKVELRQFYLAYDLLKGGPRAQEPTWRAIRKTIGRLRRGDFANKKSQHVGGWRTARSV